MILEKNPELEHCTKCINDDTYENKKCDRLLYLNWCLPLFDIQNCKHNIVDIDNYYLKYNSDAELTYKLENDFTFTLVEDFSSIITQNDNYNIENLYNYISYNFKLDKLEIPIYYFFIRYVYN
jgi:hypothetical protein